MEAYKEIDQEIKKSDVCQACLVSVYNGERFIINQEKNVCIGRNPEQSDIYIAEEIVSRQHAIISKEEDFFLVDVGSTNGTYLNGKKIKVNKKYRLEHYDVIAFSKFKYRFENDILKEKVQVIDEGTITYVDVSGSPKLCLETDNDKSVISYQYKMIQNNTMRALLDMTIMESKSCSRIYYDVEDKESLDNWIKLNGVLEKNDVIELFLSIINTIESAEQYLLKPDGFLLESQYIFFDKDKKNRIPYLIYLPLDGNKKYTEKLMDLTKSITGRHLTEAGQNLLIKMSKVLFNNDFSIKDLKKILIEEYETINQISDKEHLIIEANTNKKMIKHVKKYCQWAFVSIQTAILLGVFFFILNGFSGNHTRIYWLIFILIVDAGFLYKFVVSYIKQERRR